ncbi:MAG: PDZ domain-containing protein [Acidobacteria bacterium]|nr:PDZ domain-containing protein [Acidobacteriota bacterium]
MSHKGKVLVFLGSFLIAVYGLTAAFYGKVVAQDDAYRELRVFMEVLDRINDDYVEVPNMNAVQDGAMRGLIDALDPYSTFLTRQQYEELQKRKENGKAGAGVVLSKRSNVVYVVSTDKDGAAAEAGIRPGDYLVAINDKGVENKSIMEVDSLLHGVPGTKVKLTVFRSSSPKPLDFEMIFKNPTSTPVVSRMLEGQVGLLDISSLADSSAEQARIKLKNLISKGAAKLILDLRDCADGNPSEGADLANLFLKSGTIYYSQNRQGEKVEVVDAVPSKHVTDMPLVVLIDSSTAAAAEIAAGALKDSKRATVVGEKSFGVGSAQKTIPMKSGALLILSIAKYYTPGGKVIQDDESATKTGISPDVEAPNDDQRQVLAVESYYGDRDTVGPEGAKDDRNDPVRYREIQEKIEKIQLDKALEILAGVSAPAKKVA